MKKQAPKHFDQSDDFQYPNQQSLAHHPSQQSNPKSGYQWLLQQNNNLKRKLYILTEKLEEQKKAFEEKNKIHSVNYIQKVLSPENQSIELKNAHRAVQRLQKVVHNYQSNQSYQLTLKKILELDNKVRSRTDKSEELISQLKQIKKSIKQKEMHIKDLQDQQVKIPDFDKQKQQIHHLKQKLKKQIEKNKQLKKKELSKHEKLIKTEQRILQIEKEDEKEPLPTKDQQLQNQIQEYRQKHKDAVARVQKQKLYISKLKNRLSSQDPKAQLEKALKHQISINLKKQEIPEVIENSSYMSQSTRKNKEQRSMKREWTNDQLVQQQRKIKRQQNSIEKVQDHKKDFKEYVIDNIPNKKLPNKIFRRL